MKKYYFIFCALFLILFFPTCSSSYKLEDNYLILEKLPELNDLFKYQIKTESYLLTLSGQSSKSFDIVYNNIHYSISTNDSNKIIFISTNDTNFITADKIKIGTPLSEFPDHYSPSVNKEAGWAYFIKLKSGWNAAFTEGESMTNKPLTQKSKVSFFFKR